MLKRVFMFFFMNVLLTGNIQLDSFSFDYLGVGYFALDLLIRVTVPLIRAYYEAFVFFGQDDLLGYSTSTKLPSK